MSSARQWPVCHKRRTGLSGVLTGRQRKRGILSLHDSGLWALAPPRGDANLRLVHAWPAFAWMTLRFQPPQGGVRGKPLELTVWKRGLPDDNWRELRVCVARQLAMPQRRPQKEPA
ncbi:MAG: hypothetical protein WBF88_19160 [Pusillimonas sp.]